MTAPLEQPGLTTKTIKLLRSAKGRFLAGSRRLVRRILSTVRGVQDKPVSGALVSKPKIPLVSVIVPIYNVEEYLRDCLDSLAEQTHSRLEILLIDDGSLDGSAAIAEEYSKRDPRFIFLSKKNGGLGHARNYGANFATGDYISFVDSDDKLTKTAIQRLVQGAEEGSADIAVGAMRRFNSERSWEPEWIGRIHAESLVVENLRDFPELLRNNYTWGKVYRRDFWDREQIPFREGVAYEDQPVVSQLLAHARGIAVLPSVVYLYRAREDSSSISQQTGSIKDLVDRIAAWDLTVDWLIEDNVSPVISRAWFVTIYQTHLHWYLNNQAVLDAEYWSTLREALLRLDENAPVDISDDVHPARRVAIDLLRTNEQSRLVQYLADEAYHSANYLLEESAGSLTLAPLGDSGDLARARGRVAPETLKFYEQMRTWAWSGSGENLTAKIGGVAAIVGVDLTSTATHVTLVAQDVASGRSWDLPTNVDHDPILMHTTPSSVASSVGSGFTAEVDFAELLRDGESSGRFQFNIRFDIGGFSTTVPLRNVLKAGSPFGARPRVGPGSARIALSVTGRPEIRVTPIQALISAATVDSGALQLTGASFAKLPPHAVQVVDSVSRKLISSIDVVSSGSQSDYQFTANLDLATLRQAAGDVELFVAPLKGKRSRLFIDGPPQGSPDILTQLRSRSGWAAFLGGNEPWANVVSIEFDDDTLNVLVAQSPTASQHLARIEFRDNAGVRIVAAEVPQHSDAEAACNVEIPLKIERDRFGPRYPSRGTYKATAVFIDSQGTEIDCPLEASENLYQSADQVYEGEGMTFAVQAYRGRRVQLSVRSPLLAEERGVPAQKSLIARVRAEVHEPLQGALFRSYFGEQATCNGLAVTEELRRRGSQLPIFWAVRDGSVPVPPGTTPVIHNSAEWFRRLQSSKYYMDNMFQQIYHQMPPGQVIIQTFHGYPYKLMGHALWESSGVSQARIESYDRRAKEWSYLVSPAPYATPLLRREFAYDGEVLEVGYPRNDVLLSPDASAIRSDVRKSLGIAEDTIAVLYAPTFRDKASPDGHRARFVDMMNVDEVAEELGPRYQLLVRGHAFNARMRKRVAFSSSVKNVTLYPEVSDLYLAADVAVADYSSLRFDFAVTGKPMVFFVPDLEEYDDHRGGMFPYGPTAPGPQVVTGQEVLDALRDIDGLRTNYADKYASFRRDFISLEDGHAARRVVDAVFVPRGDAPASA